VHERRWQRRIDRAPVMTPEEHAELVGVKEIEEPIGCSLCGERRLQPLLHPKSPKKGRWSYHVVRCVSCGLLYRHPGIRPERLGDLYADKYSSFLGGGYAKKRQRRYRLMMKAFTPLFDEGEGRRLFDFGCGNGLFLDVAYERGFDTYGVDLSPDSIETARERPSGANAYFGAPMDVPEIAAGGFDVITLWSVLAHLTNPVEDFRMLRGLLKPDGVLLVLTVNANSLGLKAAGAGWNGFTKNHLKFFSPTTLPLLLRTAGFEAWVTVPTYTDQIEAGKAQLSARNEARLRRTIDDGNRGNMLRAVGFADADGPRRWGLHGEKL
jgi:SAM-dependent methyltransferase